jgi:CDGSH-type Zn-finger protein
VKNWKGETKMARVVRCDRSRPYLIQVGGQNVAICACGLSKNKPYCDGTHKITRDEEAGKIYAYNEQRTRIVVQVTDENGNTVTLPAETVDE